MLTSGDTIAVVAPSACFDSDLFHQGIACLEAMGFLVHIPPEIFDKKRYLAGEDHIRAQVVNQMFADPDIKGIISARGGFGAMRILDNLDWDMLKNFPTLVMGFSDTTALLSALIDRVGIPVVHSPNLLSLATADAETLDSFFRVITGDVFPIKAAACLGKGRAQGIFKGGNLSVLSHLVGTRYQPDFTDAVLFLEDVREPAYKIDRMLSQMKMAGMFDSIRGVVTGDFFCCDNAHLLPEILEEFFIPRNIPVLVGIKAGHGDVNLSLPMGLMVSIDTQSLEVCWERV